MKKKNYYENNLENVVEDNTACQKEEKGITLIALIITIIVILILVAVSVRTISKSGLFDHAKDATSKWADEQEKEANIGDEVDNIIEQYVNEHNWKRTGDDLYCAHCNRHLQIGDFLGYEPDPTSKDVRIPETESGLAEWVGNLNDNNVKLTTLNDNESAKIVQVSYIPNEFYQEENTYWRVLGIQDSDGNGTNETLLIKMANTTREALELYGATGYNNGPDIMNRVCKELYSSTRYGQARSITIEDINNTLGYKPGGGMYTTNPVEGQSLECRNGAQIRTLSNSSIKKGKIIRVLEEIQPVIHEARGKLNTLPIWDNIVATGNFYTPDGTNTVERLGSYELNGYMYGINNVIENSRVELINPATNAITNATYKSGEVLFTNTGVFFLANQGIMVQSTEESRVGFGLGCMNEIFIGNIFEPLIWSSGEKTKAEFPLCPVVELKDEIPEKISDPRG